MGSNNKSILTLSFCLALSLSMVANAQGLKVGYYSKTCPKAEAVILDEVKKVMSIAPSLAGPLLRLHFHDCFVNGCDASVLLNGTKDNPAEKESPPNLSLRGYTTIDRVKARLEKVCPGVVSCSDIIAVVARDVVHLSKGPRYELPMGRKDGTRSTLFDTLGNLPPPQANFSSLMNLFSAKGLTVKDLVVLSGAHTVGTSHCSSFSERLYDSNGKQNVDPSLDSNYASKLLSRCKPLDNTTLVQMDPGSHKNFNNDYFKLIAKRRSLFTSDDVLRRDAEAKAFVLRYAKDQVAFFHDFAISMIAMGNLAGNGTQVRKHCARVNH